MVNIGIFYNASSFESQILNYKLDTKFEILCFVTKAQVSLLFTNVFYGCKFHDQMLCSVVDDIIYESGFFAKTYFVKEIVIPSFTLFVNIYKNRVFFTFTSVSLLY